MKDFDGLTSKQKAWMGAYLDLDNRETFFNMAASARAAGYNCRGNNAPKSFPQIGRENLEKLRNLIGEWMDEAGLTELELKCRLAQGLNCTETKYFSHLGVVTVQRETIPWEIRCKYLDMAIKVQGLYPADRFEIKSNERLSQCDKYADMPDEILDQIIALMDEWEQSKVSGTKKP